MATASFDLSLLLGGRWSFSHDDEQMMKFGRNAEKLSGRKYPIVLGLINRVVCGEKLVEKEGSDGHLNIALTNE
jgi:hypothetical protein